MTTTLHFAQQKVSRGQRQDATEVVHSVRLAAETQLGDGQVATLQLAGPVALTICRQTIRLDGNCSTEKLLTIFGHQMAVAEALRVVEPVQPRRFGQLEHFVVAVKLEMKNIST